MTRAADRLGAGSSFGAVARPRSERGRAKAVAEGAIPEYELQRLELVKVRPSLVNPRTYFGTEEEQEALGQSLARKQTTACVAVTRDAYLTLWPEHEEKVGPAEQIILNGERRYRAALRAGLEYLDFVVRDDLATSRADFIDYLMLENDERQDFNIIERARGLSELLQACDGNAAEVARRRGKDRSWVGNQIALLALPAEIQQMLIDGAMAERYARRLARALRDDASLGVASLLAMAEQLKSEEKDRREQEKELLAAAKANVLSADNTPRAEAPARAGEHQAVPQPEGSAGAAADPAAAADPGAVEGLLDASSGESMLSADNIPEQRAAVSEAPTASPRSASAIGEDAGSVLSADNTSGASEAGQASVATGPTPADLVQALGATAAEQAATLRAGLDDAAFTALLEELHAKL